MAFNSPDDGDTIENTDITQFVKAWDGTAGSGEPFQCNKVDSATKYAGEFKNAEATNSFALRVLNDSDEVLLRCAKEEFYWGKTPTCLPGTEITNAVIAAGTVTPTLLAASSVTATKLAASAVTATKLADNSVNATAIGNRVPMLTHRQGGSATVWSTAGTTTRTPTAVRMQCGTRAVVSEAAVTFPTAFSYAPVVMATPKGDKQGAGESFTVQVKSITTTGFQVAVLDADGAFSSSDVYWLAIGPE